MNDALKIVLSLSLSGSILILILHLLRPLFKDRLNKRWQYYIWLVVIARLLLPFAPETNLMGILFQGIDKGIEQMEFVSSPGQGAPPIPEVGIYQSGDMEHEQGNLENGGPAPTAPADNPAWHFPAVLLQNLWLGWLVVALILFIRKITIYQGFVKYIRAGCKEVADIDLLERFGKLVEQDKVKITVELYTNNLISSPLLIGFFRPCIVLPSADLPHTDFEYTIRHELTHYKRRDMFYKWLVQFTACVHWFNPLVYLMSWEVGRACELSCDEAVIKALEPQERRAYGDTLINALEVDGNYKNSLASVTLNESKERLKERLDAIMRFQQKSKFVVSITLLVTILFCAAATTVGAYAATSATDNNTPWSNMGGTGQPYTYSQTGYFQGAYIFELGWNLNEKGYNAYVDKANLTLSDGTVITVSFDKSYKSEAQDQAVLSDLKDLIDRLKVQNDNSTPLETPLVVSVKYVGDSDLIKLAEEYYTNGELTRFSAIFSSLDIEVQKEYCNKMIEDNKNAFLSSTAMHMATDIIEYCAEKTYQKNDIALFTNLVPYLTDDQKQTWITRASRDKRNTFLAVLTRQNYTFPPTLPTAQLTEGDTEKE